MLVQWRALPGPLDPPGAEIDAPRLPPGEHAVCDLGTAASAAAAFSALALHAGARCAAGFLSDGGLLELSAPKPVDP